jgi:hypothetical protein
MLNVSTRKVAANAFAKANGPSPWGFSKPLNGRPLAWSFVL